MKDGKVVFQQGWGLRDINGTAKVDEHTRFQVASNSKAMTAAALAILLEERKLGWDDRLIDHLPWFRLGGDPYITREFRVRDPLSHRSGLSLGQGDLLIFGSTYSSREIAERLRFLSPPNGFRAGYAYDNVLYIVADGGGCLRDLLPTSRWRHRSNDHAPGAAVDRLQLRLSGPALPTRSMTALVEESRVIAVTPRSPARRYSLCMPNQTTPGGMQ